LLLNNQTQEFWLLPLHLSKIQDRLPYEEK